MTPRFTKLYMDMAKRVSAMSYARRLQVGCVIVKNDIVHPGYNGMPSGVDNNCEDVEWLPINEPLSEYNIAQEYPLTGIYEGVNGTRFVRRYRLVTKPEVRHAEHNAHAKMVKAGIDASGSDVFITHAPCIHCATMLSTAKVNSVTFADYYRNNEGIMFLLNQTPIRVIQFNE